MTPGPSVPVRVAFGCRNAAPVITRPGEETKSPAELVVHPCGRCGYVGASEREPEPPAPKWLQPKRGSRYSKQLLAETRVPTPMKPGRPARCDYE